MDQLAKEIGFRFDSETPFVAGSMFWGRTAAFAPLLAKPPANLPFETEMGRIDGTLAHALERAMVAVVQASGHRAVWS
jgi:lipopolysaccharide biosynthesis protein